MDDKKQGNLIQRVFGCTKNDKKAKSEMYTLQNERVLVSVRLFSWMNIVYFTLFQVWAIWDPLTETHRAVNIFYTLLTTVSGLVLLLSFFRGLKWVLLSLLLTLLRNLIPFFNLDMRKEQMNKE